MTRTINIVNRSTVVSAADFAACVAALQIQIARDFAPWWPQALNVQITAVPDLGPTKEQILVLDNSDQADALGYHTLAPADVPIGYCFAKTSQDAGDHWQATLSHELMEQVVDPFCGSMALAPWAGHANAALAYEVADAVENQEYGINSVPMSNFVTPFWFLEGSLPAGQHADFMNTLKTSLTLTAGGYMSYSLTLKSWLQTFAEHTPAHQRTIERYTRRHRRMHREAYRKAA